MPCYPRSLFRARATEMAPAVEARAGRRGSRNRRRSSPGSGCGRLARTRLLPEPWPRLVRALRASSEKSGTLLDVRTSETFGRPLSVGGADDGRCRRNDPEFVAFAGLHQAAPSSQIRLSARFAGPTPLLATAGWGYRASPGFPAVPRRRPRLNKASARGPIDANARRQRHHFSRLGRPCVGTYGRLSTASPSRSRTQRSRQRVLRQRSLQRWLHDRPHCAERVSNLARSRRAAVPRPRASFSVLAIKTQCPSPRLAFLLIIVGQRVSDSFKRLQPGQCVGGVSVLGGLVGPVERACHGLFVPNLGTTDRVVAGCHQSRSCERPAGADAQLARTARVLPRTPPWAPRHRTTRSARWQRGHASPSAHKSIAGTTDLQAGQRTWARSTISPSPTSSQRHIAAPDIAAGNTPDEPELDSNALIAPEQMNECGNLQL
jgi:hypothetical protein